MDLGEAQKIANEVVNQLSPYCDKVVGTGLDFGFGVGCK